MPTAQGMFQKLNSAPTQNSGVVLLNTQFIFVNPQSIKALPRYNYHQWRENFKRSKTAKSGLLKSESDTRKVTRASSSRL